MTNYTALVTDLDGTAIRMSSDGSEVNDATRAAVQRALAKGCRLTCATGREWGLVKPVVKHLGFVDPCVIEGGTRIVDPKTDKTLWEKHLDDAVAQTVFALFKQEAIDSEFMTSDNVKHRPLRVATSILPGLRFLYANGVPQAAANKLVEQINGRMTAIAHCTPSWAGQGLFDVHVTHPEATKQHSIQVWQQMTGITQAETIGLGDSGNDIPIFQAAGLKLAVATATDDLKALADEVIPADHNNALHYAIDKFLIPTKKGE